MLNWIATKSSAFGMLKCSFQPYTFYRPCLRLITFTSPNYTTGPPIYIKPSFLSAFDYLSNIAVCDRTNTFTYRNLLENTLDLANKLVSLIDVDYLDTNQRISFICDNDASYVIALWAIWHLRITAVPLCQSHPISELEYFITNSKSCLIIGTNTFDETLKQLSSITHIPYFVINNNDFISNTTIHKKESLTKMYDLNLLTSGKELETLSSSSADALIVYTSGTTGKPKGVVHTHHSLMCQIQSISQFWEFNNETVMLHCLPLHHIHGIVNALLAPLACGGTCIMLRQFTAKEVWEHLLHLTGLNVYLREVNTFTAVPTIYSRLLEYYKHTYLDSRAEFVRAHCLNHIRLMMSGSSALSERLMSEWEAVTGHRLLERYGMTEIGMALSNSLHSKRFPGCVGSPMPGVKLQITTPNAQSLLGYDVIASGEKDQIEVRKGKEGQSGELMIKSTGQFRCYWGNPEATRNAFSKDGWFITGDSALVTKDNVLKIIGRTSVDIIKSGGYKISALEIEQQLLLHPKVSECAVFGVPDPTWGERVAAVITLHSDSEALTVDDFKASLKDKLAPYKIPSIVKCVRVIKRNNMGKINKKQLSKDLFA